MKINDLTEAKYGLSTTQRTAYARKITTKLADIDAALEQYGPQIEVALKAFKEGRRIFRGVPSGAQAMIVDPTKVERKAANTFNFMNIMQGSLPSWKGWPQRNRSLICTTSYKTAAAYGFDGRFTVLPFGDPVIGIVPSDDWFRSFTQYGGPQWVNNELSNFYAGMYDVEHKARVPLPETKPQFYAAIKQLQAWSQANPDKVKKILQLNPGSKFIKALLAEPSFVEGLNNLLDPATNGFKMMPMSTFKAGKDVEVWFSGPALLVHADVMLNKFKVDKRAVK